MILSLRRKLVVFLLLILCAPLYVLLRFFYGGSFFRMVLVALFLNLLAAPFLSGFFHGHPLAEAYDRHYAHDYVWALFTLAAYVVPIHLLWMVFSSYAKDGRHDVDDPGRPLVPFVHPWLIELPMAVALPFVVAALGAEVTVLPVALPEWAGFTLPVIPVRSEWWSTAVLVSAAYVGVAVLTVEPPRLRLRRRLKLRGRPRNIPFDTARIAVAPFRAVASKEDILTQRSPALRGLAEAPPEHPQ